MLLVGAIPAQAQYRDPLLRLPLAAREPAVVSPLLLGGHRNPVLAGALSAAVFPGLGSFYAGHARHGVTHVVIGLASFGGMLVGALDCTFLGMSGEEHAHRSCAVADASAWVFVGNWGWSIVSAVNDANAHNRRAAAGASDRR